jgi:hypothetical protein
MAKLWTTKDGVMTRMYKDDVDDLTIDLHDLFPDFDAYDAAQQGCILNGEKQKLSDTIARSKDMTLTEAEKRAEQEALWTRNSVDRLWNMEKTTGVRGPSVSYKTIVPALEASGLSVDVIAATLSTTVERVQPFMTVTEDNE